MITDPIRSKVSQADKTFHITTSTEAKMFRLRCGQQWLHWSGTFLTDLRAHAWAGTRAAFRREREAQDAQKVAENEETEMMIELYRAALARVAHVRAA